MNITHIWANSPFKIVALSPQEQRVLDHMVKGDCCKTSAHIMGITIATVKQYRSQMFQKLKARNAPHAVAIALRMGLTD